MTPAARLLHMVAVPVHVLGALLGAWVASLGDPAGVVLLAWCGVWGHASVKALWLDSRKGR